MALGRKLIGAALLLALLSACGGGGDTGGAAQSPVGGGTTPPTTTPPTTTPPVVTPPAPTAPSVTMSPTSVSVQGTTGSVAPTTSVHVLISNPPTTDFYYLATAQHTAVVDADALLSVPTEGNITLKFWSPNSLGAGTYTDSVRFRLCSDNQCAQVISDVSVPVTYTVTGSPTPLTYFNSGPASSTQIEAQSNSTTSPTIKIALNVFDLPPQGLYVRFNEQPQVASPKFISNVTFRQTGATTGEFTLTLAAPTTLEARSYASNLQVLLCFDSACTRPVTGSPLSTLATYRIYASEGREYSKMDLALNARSAALDPVGQRLYVLQVATTGTSLVSVDPVSGTAGSPVPVPDESTSIVISDDGQFAYVNSTYSSNIYRYRLPGLVADGTIQLGGILRADRIAVAPGAPHTLAVALSSSGVESGVAIYDDLVKRSNNGSAASSIGWGATSSVLYSQDRDLANLRTWSVSATGLDSNTSESLPGNAGSYRTLTYVSGRLYSSQGVIYDFAAHAFAQPLPGVCCGHVTYDIAKDRAFSYELGVLRSYVLSTRTEASTILDSTTFRPRDTPAIRWGTNGLALVNYDGHLIILTGSFVSP